MPLVPIACLNITKDLMIYIIFMAAYHIFSNVYGILHVQPSQALSWVVGSTLEVRALAQHVPSWESFHVDWKFYTQPDRGVT